MTQLLKDYTAVLPNGESFVFWEQPQNFDRILHVSVSGCDKTGDGSKEAPFASINAAAAIATPGTKVLIHAGTYRECVDPAMGGENADKMIAYEAAGDGEVIVKASEIAGEFSRSEDFSIGEDIDGTVPVIWEHCFDTEMFHGYNPFGVINCIHEKNWLVYARTEMEPYMLRRGMVFVDGVPLKQVQLYRFMTNTPGSYWVEENGLKIHIRLPNDDAPENHLIEVSCREQCFAPKKKFLSYIKVKGITFAHASNGGPVPQEGAVSLHRGHHWIIEDCVIDWANALGIDVGNEGWSLKQLPGQIIGHSILRRNKIQDCGVCGVAGIGASGMLVEDNLFTRTGWQHMEFSWEAGALKFHNSISSLFRRNIFTQSDRCAGIWMDCGNDNNRFTQNLFLNIRSPHGMIYMECNRGGVNLIDNNIFWNSKFYQDPAEKKAVSIAEDNANWNDPFDHGSVSGDAIHGDGTDDLWIANNLIGNIDGVGYSHNVVQHRMHSGRGGTSRNSTVNNNVFYDCRLAAMRLPNHDNTVDGNVYAKVPQGFLKILYPAPSVSLDLAAWQRFEGYDLHGCYAAFTITVDEAALTMKIASGKKALRWTNAEIDGYQNIAKVEKDELVDTDYFGNMAEGSRQPGPFTVEAGEVVFSIDPRK